MPFEDKILVCEDCGCEFEHTAEDQARYAERGFTSEPKRCRPCRENRKARQQGGGGRRGGGNQSAGGRRSGGERRGSGGGAPRPSFEATCAQCGVSTTVPFKPTGDRPVYCRDCYRQRR